MYITFSNQLNTWSDSRWTDHKPYKPSIKPIAAACVLNNIWSLAYLRLPVIMIPTLTYIGCYFQLQWFITSGLSSKELALGTTAIVFELFISHLILGKFCFKLQLKSYLFSPIAQVLFPSLPLGRMFQHILLTWIWITYTACSAHLKQWHHCSCCPLWNLLLWSILCKN